MTLPPTVAAGLEAPATRPRSRGWHIALWILQVLVALGFAGGAIVKLATPLDQLALKMHWVQYVPSWLPEFVAIVEIIGALGLILPAATRRRPELTPLAAAGFMTVMLLAAGLHLRVGDYFPSLMVNGIFFTLSAIIAYGRYKLAPIAPRA